MSVPAIPTILQDAAEGRATLLTWTVDEYHDAIRAGFLAEDPTFELLDGLIVRKDRSATGADPRTIGDRHRVAVIRLANLATRFDAHGCFLQSQQPVALPPRHEPEPDAAVVRGSVDDFLSGPPGAQHVLCVIEVADASLRRDRTVKLKAYAAAGVPLYVIVNLLDDQVELYTAPAVGGYGPPVVLKAGQTLALPTASSATVSVPVDRLLP